MRRGFARSLHNSTCPHQNRNFKAGKRPLGENARLPLRARKNIVIVLKILSFLFILAVWTGRQNVCKRESEQDRGRLRAGTKESVTTFRGSRLCSIIHTGCPVTGDRTKFHFCILSYLHFTFKKKSYVIFLILNIEKKTVRIKQSFFPSFYSRAKWTINANKVFKRDSLFSRSVSSQQVTANAIKWWSGVIRRKRAHAQTRAWGEGARRRRVDLIARPRAFLLARRSISHSVSARAFSRSDAWACARIIHAHASRARSESWTWLETARSVALERAIRAWLFSSIIVL